MKFLGVLLAVFAVSCVLAEQEDCTEERVEDCMLNMFTAIVVKTEEEICKGLRSTADCLREVSDECLGVDTDSDFEELEKLLKESCETDDDNDNDDENEEIQKCKQENEDYMKECIPKATQQTFALLIEKDLDDENAMKCLMYGLTSACLVDRTREKCGEKAARMAELKLDDAPEEIVDACNAAGEIEGIHLIGDKKRK